MATTRKRNSGFIAKTEEPKAETVEISELLDEVATEMFETISRIEETVEEVSAPVAPPAPPVHVLRAVDPPPVIAPPKRHRRNVPRFSDSK